LRAARAWCGLSIGQVSNLSGISAIDLEGFESGHSDLNAEQLAKLTPVFRASGIIFTVEGIGTEKPVSE
jgi:predicted transcriptional regulator